MATLLIGLPHLNRTVAFSKADESMSETSLKVLSYNVRVFNLYQYLNNPEEKEKSKSLIEWLVKQPVDVIAIQEYYEDNNSSTFNISEKMAQNGFIYSNIVARRKVKENIVIMKNKAELTISRRNKRNIELLMKTIG